MPEERPIGSIELAECLAEDPFGTVYRGREWIAPRKTHEVLVRRYHPVWLELGLATRQHEVRRNLVHLGHLKPFKGCHASREGSPQLVWPFASGRSLAHVLEVAESQDMPFGIDQALFLVWALSHHIRQLHQVELSPGILTPHRVWIGFDGWVQLLDVPVVGILQELLPSLPGVQNAMQAYLLGPAPKGLDFDAFQLGALLFEMLTHHPLPSGRPLGTVLEEGRVGGGQEPIPEAIARLLNRLLGLSDPFQTLEDLERSMEASVFGGDFDPSTFGLAFLMQTLFRQEIATSAMSLSRGSAEPEPLPQVEAVNGSHRLPGPSGAARLRRAALLTATFLIGGTVIWFGTRAVTHSGALASVPANPPQSPSPPAPSLSPTIPPAPVPATAGRLSPSIPVAPATEQPLPQQTPLPPLLPAAASQVPVVAKGQAVRLRVFVDEQGRVRQVHLLSGATAGSERERAAYAAAMAKSMPPTQSSGQALRSWEELTVMVP